MRVISAMTGNPPLCTVLINVYVASPDPDPNPRGGGQLPNPKSAILR